MRGDADVNAAAESADKWHTLATDFSRLWRDPNTPDRERKRLAHLLLEDVTLIKREQLLIHIRFPGGATGTLELPRPRRATVTQRSMITEVDRLLDEHSDEAPSPGTMPYDLNDLVLRGSREIFTTDTEGHHVCGFDRASHSFTEIKLYWPVFYPNGITLSGDGNVLFVADILGIIRVDLLSDESEDVDPGAHNTLSGIDGLYWNKGEFLGVQYGTGTYRVMPWKLSPDGRKVTASETLEYRTDLVSDPTTGVVLGDNFYFIANTGIYNLEDDKIVDPAKLEPVHIAVVALK